MGVDGAEYTPGNLWGHALIDGTTLTAGTHEFDVLGFEDCCDVSSHAIVRLLAISDPILTGCGLWLQGHSEMELHLTCKFTSNPPLLVLSRPFLTAC